MRGALRIPDYTAATGAATAHGVVVFTSQPASRPCQAKDLDLTAPPRSSVTMVSPLSSGRREALVVPTVGVS
jgi:hypothetical protein